MKIYSIVYYKNINIFIYVVNSFQKKKKNDILPNDEYDGGRMYTTAIWVGTAGNEWKNDATPSVKSFLSSNLFPHEWKLMNVVQQAGHKLVKSVW